MVWDVLTDGEGWPYLAEVAGSPPELNFVPFPTAADVATFLGQPLDAEQQATATVHLKRASQFAKIHTRGRGFALLDCAEPLASVIVSAAARSFLNPTNDARVAAGQWQVSPGGIDWSLSERLVLDQYRRRTA